MKIQLLDSRRQFRPSIHFGPVMWHCTNGAPNYRQTWQIYGYHYRHVGGYGDVKITPAVVVTPWHKSCLASMEPLGKTTHAASIGVEFWDRIWSIHLMRVVHTKTQSEIPPL